LRESGADLVFDSMKELFEKWEAFSKNWLKNKEINSTH
jgi:hypothetical protein